MFHQGSSSSGLNVEKKQARLQDYVTFKEKTKMRKKKI
jgi:hypothetical protein